MSPILSQQIEARRIKFAAAWADGRSPAMEDFVDGFPASSRPELLKALLFVELTHRRDALGNHVSKEQLIAAHPHLAAELQLALQDLNSFRADSASENLATQFFEGSKHEGQTIEHTPSRKDSRGLRIRCPHCSNQVELLTDTPYEEISCSTCGSSFSLIDREASTRMATPLKTIDRFDLISRLGVGGFGTVWKARDRELDRVVAVKMPRRGQLTGAEIDQFFREARAAAQLRHPNIVNVHEVGRDGDTLFIVSDFVRGVTLADWKTSNQPSAKEAVRLCMPIADALHHAHQQGVVHRDLKPANILLDESNQPLLTDFGLAKREIGEITMTVDGQILGTPGYMSPEQAGGQGHWTDRRTDIYSLGVMLFELLTGELPFRGNAQMQIHNRLTQEPPDPRKLNRHIPRDLSTICLKCLEREPGRRFATAAELLEEFRRFERGEPIRSRPLSAPARVIRWAQRKPLLATTAALIIFLAIAGPLAALLINRQRNRLEELVGEKNHLIEQYAADKQQDVGQIAKLSKEVALWEGKANPWDFWPPAQTSPPRKKLMQELASAAAVSGLVIESTDPEQKAFEFLALAIMNDELERAADAVKNYEAARTHLSQLVAMHPSDTKYALALADCCRQLSRLQAANNREEAARVLEQGRSTMRQLAEKNSDPRLQAESLETELESAVLQGFAEASESLDRAQKISREFDSKIPSDAVSLYELACFLGGREPILVNRSSDVSKE